MALFIPTIKWQRKFSPCFQTTVSKVIETKYNLLVNTYKWDIIELTVLSRTQNGRENGEFASEVYRSVSFSAPNKMASSNRMAIKQCIKLNRFKRIEILLICKLSYKPNGYIFNWKGSIILFDINVWALSPCLGNNGNQTLIPWAPQYNHNASVRCGLFLQKFIGDHTFSTHDAKTVGACNIWDCYK